MLIDVIMSNKALGPFTLVKISGLRSDWVQDNAFTLCHLGMDVSHAQLSSTAGLSMARIPQYISCCLGHRVVVRKYSRQIIHLEQWWCQTSDLSLVQMADVNTATCAEPKLSQWRALPRPQCKWHPPLIWVNCTFRVNSAEKESADNSRLKPTCRCSPRPRRTGNGQSMLLCIW